MQVRTTQLKQRFDQQIEQNRHSYEELIKSKFEKRKISMNTVVDKKDLHYILNSFLKGDVFQEDILNQFWTSHFKQTATIADVVRTYFNGIMYVLDKIVESNIKVFELGKDRQKYKQSTDFKMMNQTNLEIQQLNVDLNQYTNDLAELSKPFDIDLTPLILKYKPYKIVGGEGQYLYEDNLKLLGGVFENLKQEENQRDQQLKEQDELRTEEKYYRFVIYVSTVVFIGDISLSFSKYNFVDLISSLLLILNSLFEYYLAKEDPFFQKVGYMSINYVQNRIEVEQPQPMTTFNPNSLAKQQPRAHSFQRYTYSSLYLMSVTVLIDLLWVLLLREPFYFSSGPSNPLILSQSMWKYNHYVVYASIAMLILKILIIVLLTMIVELQSGKLLSRFHFLMNFVRFTNLEYLTELIKPNANA